MKILFLNYEYPPLGAGAGNATKCILDEYAKIPDLEVHLVTASVDDQVHEITVGGKVFIHRLPIGKTSKTLHFQSIFDILRYSWAGYRFAKKLLSEGKFDALHAFFSVPCGAQAHLLSRRFKIPYIVSLRGSDVPGYSERFSGFYIFLKPLIRFIWRYAASVISNSEGLKHLALQTNHSQKIDVIYNGIDSDHFVPRPDMRPKDAFIITVGATRVTPRKGIQYLIEAIASLVGQYPQLRLKVLGDGNDRERLEQMVSDLKLREHVQFIGRVPRDQTAPYYQEASVFVLPSMNEGMSNAMLEALASGLPIIATDTGGSQELVVEGENGFIVKMRSAEDIAEKLKRCIDTPELVQKFGGASRKRAETMSWKNIADQYIEKYHEAIRK